MSASLESARPAPASLPPVVAVDDAIVLAGVAAGYGRTTVLEDLDLRIGRGEFVGIVGPSGAGKTTVLRLLTGSADRHVGRVEVLGRSVRTGRSPSSVGYVPQLEGIDWDFPLTVEQVVLLGDAAGSAAVPWFSRREKAAARGVLERLGLGGLHRRRIRELSGGQQQRMFVARALHRRCEVLLLDEPTSGVDLATRRDVLRTLGELNSRGMTVVLTTHDLNFVASHLPRIVCMNGRVTADGDPTDVLTPASLARTYGAPMRVLRDGRRTVVVDDDDLALTAPAPVRLRTAGASGDVLASTAEDPARDRDSGFWP